MEKVFASIREELQKQLFWKTGICLIIILPSGISPGICLSPEKAGPIFIMLPAMFIMLCWHFRQERQSLPFMTVSLSGNSRGLKRIFFKWIFLKLPVKKCRFVTTISEKSKQEIVQYTGCDPSKVIVIPNPVNAQIYYREKEFNAGNPMLFFIGSTPNKNLDRIINALSGITLHFGNSRAYS